MRSTPVDQRHRHTVRIPVTNNQAVYTIYNGASTRHHLSSEMYDWLSENRCDPRIQYYTNFVVFEFDNEQQAMLFSLKWV